MAGLETLAAFALATLLFAYMPGPALLYTTARTLAHGRRAGLAAAFGIHIGCYVHVFAATFGLSAVFLVVPTLYLVLKLAGAAYLVWLGVKLFRERAPDTQVADLPMPPHHGRRAFFDSVLVEVLNPKVAIFFIAFLPQFVDPAASLPVWSQFLILGMLVNLTFSSADLVAVVFASSLKERLQRSPRWTGLAKKFGGAVLVGLGFRLALERT
ncbi:threonine/homoserine/homoserine lactone efflux protein [Rhodobium orientis]|uniref:Amino acid transporter n=1 Tax=Rhodobium orientis TaxID=34017 RepID=A0A327JIY6_9HYPH|nr:LysE family translocator [Rhodobium orientis]MBB4302048.1 threonine/homoserine/homoserine lactone efflux protein [Rhodobium orientis]MBK5950285.1 amino acid transporter [Rhodobium orientis]RAI25971.1 amino acid transporter [Rhodobium orientis]